MNFFIKAPYWRTAVKTFRRGYGNRYSLILLSFLAVAYIWIAWHLGLGIYDGGPDEVMRSLVPRCIINGNLFPTGYDRCAIYTIGNWSYAFYQQMLGSYVSALFMFIFRLFGSDASDIFVSGRLSSVFFSLIALYSIGKSVEVLFDNNRHKDILKVLAIGMVGFWPQYIFISSYMNNDIVAFSGVAIIYYGALSGIKNNWNIRNALVVSTGMVFCLLGYMNSFGFVLSFGLLCLMTLIQQNTNNLRRSFSLVGIVLLVICVFVIPFYVHNYLQYGDFFGINTFKKVYAEWVSTHERNVQNSYTGGIVNLLLHSDFVYSTFISFVGNLGYMSIPIPIIMALYDMGLIVAGFGAFVQMFNIKDFSRRHLYVLVASVLGSVITVCLYVLYTLMTDYQPQGRYIIYLLVPMVLMFIYTIGSSRILRSKIGRYLLIISFVIFVLISVYLFKYAIINYHWSGVAEGAVVI